MSGDSSDKLMKAFAQAVEGDRPMAIMFEVDDARVAYVGKNVTEGFVISALNALASRYPAQFRAFAEVWARHNPKPNIQ
ncbi:hypothetical protein [Methylobacterium oryzae]|uniref:hypothetical protein n=1 Tax=Methylobacterium oryzae TaxID=334852 RepID=UPI002F33E1CC